MKLHKMHSVRRQRLHFKKSEHVKVKKCSDLRYFAGIQRPTELDINVVTKQLRISPEQRIYATL